jgi:DNA-binding NtrC family response regulator
MAFDQDTGTDSPSARYRDGRIRFSDIWANSPAMRRCLDAAKRVAPLEIDLLILGETGTGKNLLAQAIHTASRRGKGPFVAKNTAAISPTLAEDELFGHEAGAFDGARTRRRGLFELASGGTLFLDEIGNMSLDVQAKILMAVELKRIQRLGGEADVPCDVRLICATNTDVAEAIASGKFRQDLFYRLAHHILRVPPLRERPEDIPLLIQRFIALDNATYNRAVERVSEECLARLSEYPWPGNVRELRFRVGSAVATCDGTELLSCHVFPDTPSEGGESERPDLSLAAMERRHIRRILILASGCITEAARILGISRPTLRDKIGRYGLKSPSQPSGD